MNDEQLYEMLKGGFSTNRFPDKPMTYAEGTMEDTVGNIREDSLYDTGDNELVYVKHWSVWPSYDLVFGIPTEDSPRRKLEVAYFAYRDTREGKKGFGVYLDEVELNEMITGLTYLRECHISRKRAEAKVSTGLLSKISNFLRKYTGGGK